MIVNTGKTIVVNYFAGQVGHIGDTIALGTGTTPVALTDTALATEATRVAVTSVSADTANNRIVFKATVQPGAMATISEIGVYSNGGNSQAQLVARTVLATPATVDPTVPTEIEYSIGITV